MTWRKLQRALFCGARGASAWTAAGQIVTDGSLGAKTSLTGAAWKSRKPWAAAREAIFSTASSSSTDRKSDAGRVGRATPHFAPGFLGGWPVPGSWLEPGFRLKGYSDLTERIGIVRGLIDSLNEMLIGLTQLRELGHVKHVDLRGTLSVGADDKKWRANELHPTRRGFRIVADKISAAL